MHHSSSVGAITLCIVVAAACFAPVKETRAFTPSVSRQSAVGQPTQIAQRSSFPRDAPVLSLHNSDEHDEEWLQRELATLEADTSKDGSNNRATRAVGPGRAGGRKRRTKKYTPPTRKSNNNPWNNWLVKAGVPVLAIVLLVKSFFGGGDAAPSASPSVYYYKSSYYESRVYNGNGNMERTYKSNVESNVPSLMEGRKLLPKEDTRPLLREGSPSTSQYMSSDRDMSQAELDSAIIKVQQAMFSDWY